MGRLYARKTTCKLDVEANVKPVTTERVENSAVEPTVGVAPWLSAGLPVLTLCCIIAAVCSLDRVVMSVTILPMGQQYGYTDSTRGLIASAFSFGYFFGLGPAGLASSASSPKVVLGAGLVLWSIAQAATPAAAEIGLTPLLAARAFMGLGEAAAIPSLQVIAANFVPASSRSKFWGVLTASLSMGTIAAYSFTPPLVANLGWPTAFEIFGAAGLMVAVFWAVLGAGSPAELPGYPSGKEPQALVSRGRAGMDTAGKQGLEGRAALDNVPWAEMASSRPVWALCASHASSNFFLYFALSWLPTYFACACSADTT
jgi:ACS family sodium-dependent inorganic phosphate cotransporter